MVKCISDFLSNSCLQMALENRGHTVRLNIMQSSSALPINLNTMKKVAKTYTLQ